MSSSGRTMIVLGSGGHTKEMVALLPHIAGKHRVFVVASSDAMSCKKVLEQPDDLVGRPTSLAIIMLWLNPVQYSKHSLREGFNFQPCSALMLPMLARGFFFAGGSSCSLAVNLP
eukprot:scpid102489/ scgid27262/ 